MGICYHVLLTATNATATRTHAEIATSAASQIATVATATTGIVETIATSVAAPTPARLVRSRGAAATAVDRLTGPAAAGHPTGPAAVEGLPTGQALVGETVERAILPHRHLVAMESLLHRNNKKHLCDKKILYKNKKIETIDISLE